MKKIISLCAVVLAFALMITVFTACGDNTEENTTSQSAEETIAAEGYSVVVGEASATVYKDGKEFQVLNYPINSGATVDLEYASKNNAFMDMNFDGVPDFYIAISNNNGVISYHCWLYNVTAEKFDYSVILSALQNISVDAENHRILSKSVVGGVEHVISYKWVDGQLRFDTDYNTDDGGIPEEVTQVVNDNAIGDDAQTTKAPEKTENKKPDKNNNDKEETTKKPSNSDNKTTTKVNKPANTTTTAPNVNDGLVIETGSIDDGWF